MNLILMIISLACMRQLVISSVSYAKRSRLKRESSQSAGGQNNFRNEKNNFFIYFNYHHPKETANYSLDLHTQQEVDNHDDFKNDEMTFDINQITSKPILMNRLLSILLSGLSEQSGGGKHSRIIDKSVFQATPPATSSSKIIWNERGGDSKMRDERINYMIMLNYNSNGLFRILSFFAFVLVIFSCTSSIGLLAFLLNHKYKYHHSQNVSGIQSTTSVSRIKEITPLLQNDGTKPNEDDETSFSFFEATECDADRDNNKLKNQYDINDTKK